MWWFEDLCKILSGIVVGSIFTIVVQFKYVDSALDSVKQCKEWRDKTFDVTEMKDKIRIEDNKQACYIYPRQEKSFYLHCYQPPV